MLLKSSLTVCRSISRARLPKWAAKAAATWPVAAGSLTVSGKVPAVAKSGSLGEPEAWPSACTIRRTDASMRSRVCRE